MITNIKEHLKEKYNNGEWDFFDLPYVVCGDKVKNWPQLPEPDFPESLEYLDMENFEWMSISDDEMVVTCGGDWQNPKTLTIKIIDGKLTVTKSVDVTEYKEGMSEEEFLKLIK